MNRDTKYFDINIDSGGDFTFSFTIYDEGSTPIDLTNAVVSAQLREYPEGTETTDFVCTHNGAGGQITVSMAHEATAAIGYSYGWYTVQVTFLNGHIEEILHGKAFITASVTRLSNPGTINQIIAFSSFDEFPTEGSIYRIYLDQSNYNLYWWTGTQYVSLTYAMKGDAATISVGTVTTLEPGSDATVTNSGTSYSAVFDFGIPKGAKGDPATVTIGTVETLPAGSPATITNSGTTTDAIFNFSIPRGATGFVTFPTFEIVTGDLIMHSDADYVGANFRVTDDGDLVVII